MKKRKFIPLQADRFWSHVDRSDSSKCWEWIGSRTSAGYGRIFVTPKSLYAHRISWELANGKIPAGLHVLHKCDNPPCVNPAHLFVGTAKDNAIDKSNKGRARNAMVRGTEHTLAKLTDDDVREIRRIYQPSPRKKSPFSGPTLAKKYGVAPSLIHRIVHGKSWPHVK